MNAVNEGKLQPIVVCLCGSTRFYQQFQEANYRETMDGKIVLSVGFYSHSSGQAHSQTIGITTEQKKNLDELHKRKIDLADEILVLNVGGYIGQSTIGEIVYAGRNGKRIRLLEPTILPECRARLSEAHNAAGERPLPAGEKP